MNAKQCTQEKIALTKHTAAGSKSAACIEERDAVLIVDNFLEMPTQCSEANRLLRIIKIKKEKRKKQKTYST